MQTVALVACVKAKLSRPAPARELYCSPWFRLARAYVEAQGWRWYVLSAEHGLVAPGQVIAPYEKTLMRMSKDERLAWCARVAGQARALAPSRIVFLAGRRYRADLAEWLGARRHIVEVPMAGLGIGQQLQWLKERTRAAA